MARVDKAEITVAANRETVWAALMDPAQLVQWLPPGTMTGEISAFDPRPGGAFRMTLRYAEAGRGKSSDDTDVTNAVFGEIVPRERVQWLVRFDSPDPAFTGTMKMTWQLEDAAGGTKVSIAAEDVPSGISPEDHAEGLGESLANLKRFLR